MLKWPMDFGWKYRGVLVVTVCLCLSCLQRVSAVSIALLYETGDDRLAAAMDLMQVSLTKQDDIVFLEREAIEAILKEQELGTSGLLDFETAARLNEMLKADLLAMIIPVETGDRYACDLVIYDTHKGIRLVDKELPSGDLESMVAMARKEFLLVVEKFLHPEVGGRAFCIQRVEIVDLPPESRDRVFAYVNIVERELVQQQGVILLERAHLNSLRRENELAGSPPSGLLTTAVYLDIEVGRGSNTPVQIIGQFCDNRGTVVHHFRLSGQFDEGLKWVNESVREIIAVLNVASPAVAEDSEAEAARFYRDSIRGSRLGAIRACEAACMLSPDNSVYRTRLGMLYVEAARYPIKRWPDSHGVLQRDGQPYSNPFTSVYPPKSKSWYRVEPDKLRQGLAYYLAGIGILRNLPAGATADELKLLVHAVDFDFESIADPFFPPDERSAQQEIKRQMYDYWVQSRQVDYRSVVSDPESFAVYTGKLVTDILPWLQVATVTSEEWHQKAVENVLPWLPLAQEYGLETVPTAMNDMGRFLLAPDVANVQLERPSIGYFNKTKRQTQFADILLWAPIYVALKRSGHPVLGFYGLAGESLNLRPKKELTTRDYNLVWTSGLELLDALPSDAATLRYQAYHAILNALLRFPSKEMVRRQRDLFEYMADHHEFVFGVAWRASLFRPIAVKSGVEEQKVWTDRVLDYLRRDDLVYLYPPERTARISEVFLERKAELEGVAPVACQSLVPDRTRRVRLDSSYRNGPVQVLCDDVPNGCVYILVQGFLEDRAQARPDKPVGCLLEDGQGQPHLFMEFYQLHIPEAKISDPLCLAVDHTGMRVSYADSNRLVAFRIPNYEVFDLDMQRHEATIRRLRDHPFTRIKALVPVGTSVFGMDDTSTLFEYDLERHVWSTILSPSRIKAQHPIEESGLGFDIQQLFKRPGRDEIYVSVRFPSAPGHALAGIWRLDVPSRTWSKVVDDPGYRLALSQPEEDGVWFYADQSQPVADEPTAVFFWDYTAPQIQFVCGRIGRETATGKGFIRDRPKETQAPKPPYFRYGSGLWTADPFGRVELATGEFSPVTTIGEPLPVVAFARGKNGFHVVRQVSETDFEVLDISDKTGQGGRGRIAE